MKHDPHITIITRMEMYEKLNFIHYSNQNQAELFGLQDLDNEWPSSYSSYIAMHKWDLWLALHSDMIYAFFHFYHSLWFASDSNAAASENSKWLFVKSFKI